MQFAWGILNLTLHCSPQPRPSATKDRSACLWHPLSPVCSCWQDALHPSRAQYKHSLASCPKKRVWETVNYKLNREDVLKWGRQPGRVEKIMKSSGADSLVRRILLEGEFKVLSSFERGDSEMKCRVPQPRTWRKEERKAELRWCICGWWFLDLRGGMIPCSDQQPWYPAHHQMQQTLSKHLWTKL